MPAAGVHQVSSIQWLACLRAPRRPKSQGDRRTAGRDSAIRRRTRAGGRGGQQMVEAVLRARRRKASERMMLAAAAVCGTGLARLRGRARCADRQPQPVAPRAGPAPATGSAARHRAPIRCRPRGSGRRPPTGRRQRGGGAAVPQASMLLVTGRSFDVLDVPRPGRIDRADPAGAGRDQAGTGSDQRGRTGRCSSSPPGRRSPTRTSGGPATWTASRRPSLQSPGCAGTAGTATCWRRRPG